MAVKFKWPILGLIIPTLLIASIGYGSHYFVFRHHLSSNEQIWFQFYLTMIWVSYIFAIKKDPGLPPKSFKPRLGEWKRWCKKCEIYKPERTHHCKSCNRCVLKMDHHCPWTYNCVGHANLPHFLRFLIWVIFTTGYVMVQLFKRASAYYKDRNLPSYLVDKKEMIAVIFFLPLDSFVFFSIIILLLRCIINMSFRGMSQIEVWEHERIESQLHKESMWQQIRKNYFNLHGKEMLTLTSWNHSATYYAEQQSENELDDYADHEFNEDGSRAQSANGNDSIVPKDFTIDDLIFPYDLGVWKNTVHACGYPWSWLLPWGNPSTDGYHFQKSEYMEDDQLGLPWPPDGGHQQVAIEENITDAHLSDLRTLRKRLDPRANKVRSEWFNDLGETLDDFGVDLDAEDVEHDILITASN